MKNRYSKALAVLMGVALCASCTDTWNDHYAEGDGGASTGGTLWAALQANPDLSNFASVVKACGYDVTLDGSQAFTVYAPTNAHFTSAQADSVIAVFNTNKQQGIRTTDNPAIIQFLRNHISLYKKPVSSLTNDTITMMNGKYQPLTSTAVGGRAMLSKNAPCSNGVLFTIDGKIDYYPNVYEYLGQDSELDSIYRFLSSYNNYEFSADESVPGDIIDGQTVYRDSVVHLRNSVLSTLGEINSEDSLYWMLAPTNDVWNEKVREYEQYFTYNSTVNKGDSMQHANARMALLRATVFNRHTNTDAALQDSAASTSATSGEVRMALNKDPYGVFYKPYAQGGIFEGLSPVECSNGAVMKTSDFRISPYATFAQTISIEAEYSSNLADNNPIINAEDPLTTVQVDESNPFYSQVSGHGYADVMPDLTKVDNDNKPTVTYKVNDLLSNMAYDVYVVFAPVLASDTLASAEKRLPCRFQGKVMFTDENGMAKEYNFNKTATGTQQGRPVSFETRPDIVDSVLVLSNRTFPFASYGLSETNITVRIISNVLASQTSNYSQTMHIDRILFIPHDKPADLWATSKD